MFKMRWIAITVYFVISSTNCTSVDLETTSTAEPPEGYYAFVESPQALPPRVRPPPYRPIQADCPDARNTKPRVTAFNLCGDLNRGLIPRNPMGQNIFGEPYPFELIRNQTLKFLSRTLPVLRADDTLPRVAQIQSDALDAYNDNSINGPQSEREKRSVKSLEADEEVPNKGDSSSPRESRFCEGGGVFCMLYRAINGGGSPSPNYNLERREDPNPQNNSPAPRYEQGPPTPCPARVEYATPVFARNYQGVWRYVVQIPYEGYFTQTIEVTRCMQSRCHYLDGGCLSSPRWVSMLVAELHYPQVAVGSPASSQHHSSGGPPPVHDFQNYQQYLQKRAGVGIPEGQSVGYSPSAAGAAGGVEAKDKPAHCDGHDELGCFQVRLYYDWFLVPGACKCWRPDYFARYVRRKSSGPDL